MSSTAKTILFWGTVALAPFIILGNGTVCLLILGNKKMRTFTNVLLLNLAVADLCYGLAKIIEITTLKIYAVARNTPVFCQGTIYITFVFCAVSIVTLTAMAVERYLAVYRPLQYRRRTRNPKMAVYAMATTWLVAAVVMVPTIYTHDRPDTASKDFVCGTNPRKDTFSYIYFSIIIGVFLFLPNFILVLSYTLVIYKLWVTAPKTAKPSSLCRLKSRRKLTKLLVIITIIFVVCWTSILIENCLYLAGHYIEIFEVLCCIMIQVNSLTDPVLYSFHGKKFRRSFKKILRIPWH